MIGSIFNLLHDPHHYRGELRDNIQPREVPFLADVSISGRKVALPETRHTPMRRDATPPINLFAREQALCLPLRVEGGRYALSKLFVRCVRQDQLRDGVRGHVATLR